MIAIASVRNKCLFLAVVVIFCSCQKPWTMSIVDASDFSHPTFCISKYDNCNGGGIWFSMLSVCEVNDKGEFLQVMWLVNNVRGNNDLNIVKYGITPEGFAEELKAKPLKLDTFYVVDFKMFFRMTRGDSEIKVEIYKPAEFLSDKRQWK